MLACTLLRTQNAALTGISVARIAIVNTVAQTLHRCIAREAHIAGIRACISGISASISRIRVGISGIRVSISGIQVHISGTTVCISVIRVHPRGGGVFGRSSAARPQWSRPATVGEPDGTGRACGAWPWSLTPCMADPCRKGTARQDVAGVSPVPVQMWQREHGPGPPWRWTRVRLQRVRLQLRGDSD